MAISSSETAFTFAAVTSLGGLSFVTFNVPFQKLIYKNAKKTGPLFILRLITLSSLGLESLIDIPSDDDVQEPDGLTKAEKAEILAQEAADASKELVEPDY